MLRMGSCQSGYGRLNGTGTEGETDAIYGINHLIKAKAFRADDAGQKNPVKKAKDS